MSIHNNHKQIFIVIPAFNEGTVIGDVVKDILKYGYSVVVVDDCSAVSLRNVISELPVYLLTHKVNLGQGAALQTGIEFAIEKNAEIVVTFDADGQHDARDIEKLIQPIQNGSVDLVLGSRFINDTAENISKRRRAAIQLARYLNFVFTGLLLTDAHNGLRALNNTAAKAIHLTENRMAHATEIISQVKKARLRFCEVPVTIRYTDYATKKGQRIRHGFRIFFDILLNKLFG